MFGVFGVALKPQCGRPPLRSATAMLLFCWPGSVNPVRGHVSDYTREGDCMSDTGTNRTWWERLIPRASARVQLFAAAVVWMVGLSFLLVRGVMFMVLPGPGLHFSHWLAPALAIAIVLGMIKARYVLIRYADKAVARIEHRGRACFFGFFSAKSWLFVLVMMGGGLALRQTPLVDYGWGRASLAVLYVAVGTALLIADRVFWISAIRSRTVPERKATQ